MTPAPAAPPKMSTIRVMAETIPGGTVHKLPADLRAELAGADTTLTA